MAVPVIMLDIDGVVNALSKKPPVNVWPRPHWIIGEAQCIEAMYPMMVSRAVVDFFNHLHREGLAEVRWHTTWQHYARNVAKLAGFDDFEVVNAPEYRDYGNFQKQMIVDGQPTWWKLPAAQRVVQEEKRDLIWIDDDLPYEYTRKVQFDPNLGGEQAVLLLAPYSMSGLTLKDLRQIQMFVAGTQVEVA